MARSLPNNVNAEKAVLGAMLISPEALSDSLGSLTEEEFYFGNRPNQIVFRAIKNVQDRRVPVDVQTVTEELINLKELESIGGVNYLLELTQTAISFSNLEYYIKIIKDQAVLRNLLLTMTDIASKYNEEEVDDPSDFVAIAEARIAKVAENRRISTFLSSKEIASRVEEDMRTQAKSAEDGVTGITTGYRKLNLLTHGFQRGEMIILAARPSVGKTALAINLAFNASRKADRPVAIFSLEMPAEALIKRLIATVSCVNLDQIQTGFLNSKDRLAIGEALKTVGDTKMYIDDTPGIKLLDIIAKARKLKTANPDIGLIVVDYIGLITTGNKKIESRQVEVSEISRELKELARELKVP
ncbi:MAG: replicative DNA helicase, partial [Firmicutes bacterium]|nr:replicative DNA helicase [Bacillota bacterium]